MPATIPVEVVAEHDGYWYVRARSGERHIVAACGLRKGHEIPAALCRPGATGLATYVTRANGGRWEVRPDNEGAA